MKDRETVIEALQYMISGDCTETQFDFTDDIEAAIALLKEPEAVKPKKADNPEESEYCCGICGYPLWLDELYCAHCGRRIEWESR